MPAAVLPVDLLPDSVLERYEMNDAASGRCCWRVMAPIWSFQPISNVGATINGGRWNRKYTGALYVSEPFSPDFPTATAWAEFQQGIGPRVGTLAPYEVRFERLVDLTRQATQEALGLDPEDFRCEWRSLVADGEVPPTWTISERMVLGGADALRVPSIAKPGGVNIVILMIGIEGCEARVVDPANALPVDQASWPSVRGPS